MKANRVVIAVAGSFWMATASAGGYGISVAGATEHWVKDTRAGESHTRHTSGFNFVLDPFFDSHHRQAYLKIMGYRLTVGQEVSRSAEYGGITFTGTSVLQNFAFRLVQSDAFRLWLGPQLRLVYYEVDERHNGTHYTGDTVGGGAGIVGGFDVLTGGQVGYSLSFGVRRTSYWGGIDAYRADTGYASSYYLEDIDHRANALFLDVAVIFLSR